MQLLKSKFIVREIGKCWIIRRMKMGGKYEEHNFIPSEIDILLCYFRMWSDHIINDHNQKTSGILNLVSTLFNPYVSCEMKVVAV